MAAFRDWKGFTRRFVLRLGKALRGNLNEFVLEPGFDVEICHRTGEVFAAALQRCLCEGRTAQGVEVRYVRQDLGIGIR